MASAQCQRPSEQTCQNKNTKEGHSFTEKVKEMIFHHKHPDNNGQHIHDNHKTTDCKPHSPNGAVTHGHHTNVTHHDTHKTTHSTTGAAVTHGNGCAKIEKKKKKKATEGPNGGGMHCMPKMNKNLKKKKDHKAGDGSSSSSSDSESDNDSKCCKKH